MRLSRRDLLRTALATGLAGAFPRFLNAAGAIGDPGSWDRYLILVELDGGNDGLNTLVRMDQYSLYQAGRASIGLANNTQLKSFGGQSDIKMNWNLVDGPGNGRFQALYDNGKLAVVNGVGIANPNRSHFRGIDIWNSGSATNVVSSDGWIKNGYSGTTRPGGIVAEAAILSRPTSNPVAGSGMRVLSMSSPTNFINDAQGLATIAPSGTSALQHVLGVNNEVVNARTQFETKFGWNSSLSNIKATPHDDRLTTIPLFARDRDASNPLFPTGNFGDQCRAAAEMVAAGIGVPVIKLRLGGFDNHSSQFAKHNDLLAQLAHGLKGIHDALVEKGRFDKVMMMTYSEFGRRVKQNNSNGTDHGTAAPHFIIGDSTNINSGIYGTYPSIADVDLDGRGDMVYSVDYRTMYACGLNFLGVSGNGFTPISGLLTT